MYLNEVILQLNGLIGKILTLRKSCRNFLTNVIFCMIAKLAVHGFKMWLNRRNGRIGKVIELDELYFSCEMECDFRIIVIFSDHDQNRSLNPYFTILHWTCYCNCNRNRILNCCPQPKKFSD